MKSTQKKCVYFDGCGLACFGGNLFTRGRAETNNCIPETRCTSWIIPCYMGNKSSQESPSSPVNSMTEEQPMEDQFLDESAKLFRWKIRRFSEMTETKYYSQMFSLCGETWRIMIYPKGSITTTDHLSIYLNVFDVATKPPGWKQQVNYSFILVNQINRDDSMILAADAEFNARSFIWGYSRFVPLHEITDPRKGYKVDDTLIVEVKFESVMISDNKLIGEEIVSEKTFVWKITNFPWLTGKYYSSSRFEIGGGSWQLNIFPNGYGDNQTHLELYLCVANPGPSPEGWTINAKFKLILVNQNDNSRSIIRDCQWDFKAGAIYCGFGRMISLSELHDCTGFIVNDALILKAEVTLLKFEPVSAMFDSYFTSLQQYITEANDPPRAAETSLCNEGVEKAKQSLKESLSADMFKLDMKEKLVKDLLTLCNARTGLTTNQQRTVREFWANIGEFTSDYFAFEQDNAELELQQILKDHMFSVIEGSHKTHISLKTRWDELAKEEDELKKELQEVKSQREEFIEKWEILMVQSEQEKLEYETGKKKLADAEEKKRIAEERMSRSTVAWSNLKQHFT